METLFKVTAHRFLNAVVALLLVCCGSDVAAQNGWLPPVNLSAGTQLCDNTPYKLVFSDDFPGTSLNSQWINFNSWSGMKYLAPNGIDSLFGDHENWGNARGAADGSLGQAIFLPENIEVSNGTLKLKLYYDSHTWQCASCNSSQAVSKNYTGANIAIPYIKIGTQWPEANWFNSGRFEARMKLPIAEHSYSTWWLWNSNGINEIDIAECVGDNNRAKRENKVNTHAFKPAFGQPNPNLITQDAETGTFHYPSQAWYDAFFQTAAWHRQHDWHIYTCEWDSTQIRSYIDGTLLRTLYRFYRFEPYQSGNNQYNLMVGASCTPPAGSYNVTYGYPYNDASNSQLRLGITSRKAGSYTSGRTFVDQTEVDYIRVWQRHPERDGHQPVCSPPAMEIQGLGVSCTTAVYTITNPQPNGYWSVFGFGNLATIVPGTNTTTSVALNMPPGNLNAGFLKYNYSLPNCSTALGVMKVIHPNLANAPFVNLVRSSFGLNQMFSLRTPQYPGHTYQWQCSWSIPAGNGPGNLASGTFSGTGPVIWSPPIPTYGTWRYELSYTLTVTNPCGTYVYSGTKKSLLPGLRQKPTQEELEGHTLYSAEAMLTSVDEERYNTAVASDLQTFVFPEDFTKQDVIDKEAQLRLDHLYPYLVEEDMEMEEGGGAPPDPGAGARRARGADSVSFAKCRVFPNPAHSHITATAGKAFKANESVSLTVVDITGQVVLRSRIEAGAHEAVISTADLPSATFIVMFEQGEEREITRFTKLP